MQALILVGGLGTRLRSVIGAELPKPMVDIDGRPFLEYLLLQLRRQGYSDVCLLVGHGGGVIRDHFGNGERLDLRLEYSEEATPLGTAGSLRHALGRVTGSRVLVMNGDSFLDASLTALMARHEVAHEADGVVATLALVHLEDAARYGTVELDERGAIVSFREKDPTAAVGLVSAGVYVVERSLIEGIPAGRPVSLELEVWPDYLDGRLRSFSTSGAFTDIGVPETLAAMRADPGPLQALSTGGA